MTRLPAPSAEAIAALTARAEQAERIAAERLDALAAVLEALDVPYAATVGDAEVRDPIALQRVMLVVVMLGAVLRDGRQPQPEWLVPHSIAHLRERLAEHPATAYKTWDEAVADLRARNEEGEEGHK